MAIIDKKISEVYSGRDIASLSDRPNQDGMTATNLKARFDQLNKEVIPNFNDLIDELYAYLTSNDVDVLDLQNRMATEEGNVDALQATRMNLDGSNSNIDVLSFFTETIVPFTRAGQLRWNEVLKTLELKISDDVTLQIGREILLEARNDEATSIYNGQAVYISGGAGTNAYIKRASTANVDIAQSTIGVATETMQAGHWGNTCTEGLVNGINTNAWEEGDKLYLGVDGALTNVEPVSPTPKVFMGVVLRKHISLGSIYVKVRAIPRMAKLSDVFVSSIADGHALIWNGTNGRFENEAIYNKAEVDALANARYTKTEMQTSGSALMHWDNLTNKPNFADYHWKAPVANRASLPLTNNALGDNRVVLDDGDGKQAVYTCIAITGDVDAQWSKVADVDWMTEEQTRITQELSRVSAENARVSAEGLRATAENGRVSAEDLRVTAEGLRASAESARVSAEGLRASAETTRISNENTRVSQESARNVWEEYNALTTYVVGNKVSYLGSSYRCILASTGNLPTDPTYWLLIAQKGDNTNAGAVTFTPTGSLSSTNVQTALAELDSEKSGKLFATNLVTNGDFSNGTIGWLATASTNAVSNKVLSNTANGTSQYVRAYTDTVNSFVVGNKIYARFSFKVTNANCTQLLLQVQGTMSGSAQNFFVQVNPTQNQVYTSSSIITTGSGTGVYRLQFWHYYPDVLTANGKVMEVQYLSMIDLTALFGAGNEPTKEQMDWIFTERDRLGLGYLNGTAELLPMVSLLNLINKKANIAQEAWITPTLLNGWSGIVRYAKNDLGMVIIEVRATAGTTALYTKIIDIPVGYRPYTYIGNLFQDQTISGTLSGQLLVRTGGDLVCLSAVTGRVYSGTIIYKAEV